MQHNDESPSKHQAIFPSVTALAAYIGLSRGLTYSFLNAGKIPSIRLGRRFVLPRTAIDEWLRAAGRSPKTS